MTWQPQSPPPDHPPVRSGRVGVLLTNLGTPDAPTTGAVRRYLAQFLSDRRVVELPALLWQPLLRGVILNTRPAKSAHAYRQVWSEDGSPLAAITKRQAEALQARLGDGVRVDWAMRYGSPPIGERLEGDAGSRLRPGAVRPALPAIFGRDDGDGGGRGGTRIGGDALAAEPAHAAAL